MLLHDHTIKQLTRALSVEPAVLIGETAAPETEDDSRYDLMSKLNFRISTRAHNALCLVGRRYRVSQQEIVELAPFLFCWAAEANLHQRRERLKQAELSCENARTLEREMKHLPGIDLTASEEKFSAESESIKSRDLFGISLENVGFFVDNDGTDNPFAIFLDGLVQDIGSDAMFESYWWSDAPNYRVCGEEAGRMVGGDSELAEEILCGHVALDEMPKEVREFTLETACIRKKRVEWVRTKVEEYRKGLRRLHLDD